MSYDELRLYHEKEEKFERLYKPGTLALMNIDLAEDFLKQDDCFKVYLEMLLPSLIRDKSRFEEETDELKKRLILSNIRQGMSCLYEFNNGFLVQKQSYETLLENLQAFYASAEGDLQEYIAKYGEDDVPERFKTALEKIPATIQKLNEAIKRAEENIRRFPEKISVFEEFELTNSYEADSDGAEELFGDLSIG